MNNDGDERDRKSGEATRPDSTSCWAELPPDDIDGYEEWVQLAMAYQTPSKKMHEMPFTHLLMTPKGFEQWIASRKEAGSKINIETCELGRWNARDFDPYGFLVSRGELPEIMMQFGWNRFVRSPESNGWISADDLPEEKVAAMYNRIHREAVAYDAIKQNLERAAKAVDAKDWKASNIITEAILAFAAGRGVLDVGTITHLIQSALEAGVERGNAAGQTDPTKSGGLTERADFPWYAR
jgi:hypothetical protein